MISAIALAKSKIKEVKDFKKSKILESQSLNKSRFEEVED
jgi:hypothetical protein